MRIKAGHLVGDKAADELLSAIAEGLNRSDETQVTIDWGGSIVMSSTYSYFWQISRRMFSAEERRRIRFENVSSAAKASMRSAIDFAKGAKP